MMRVRSAPNLSVVAGTGGGGGALLPSNAEKRSHAAIVDGFRQSPPPLSPSVKRTRVESVQQQPLKPSSPPLVEENRCDCVRIGQYKPKTLDDIPEYAKQRYLKVKEDFGSLWDQLDMGNHRASEDLVGDIGFLCPDPEPYPYTGRKSDLVLIDTGFLCPPEAYDHVPRAPDDILALFS